MPNDAGTRAGNVPGAAAGASSASEAS